MLKCTYIVFLHNNEDNIPHLIKSLKGINGSFKKEFIIIDDGSKDKSLEIVKHAVNDLPKTTIITHETQGPAASINKAIDLANGDYIHFVEGDEILHPESTAIMLDSCTKFGTQVACYKLKEIRDFEDFLEKLILNQKLISDPLKKIIENQIASIRNIGSSGSLVHQSLIEKIGKADNNIYSQTMSLSLRCAKYSNFVFIDNILSLKRKNNVPKDSKFESYNNLRSIYNFASNHPEIMQTLISELITGLSFETSSKKSKIIYYLQAIKSKYIKTIKLDTVLELYKTEFEKLF